MRVNARLDPEAQQQLEYLTETTGHGVSLVVREALAHYCMLVRDRERQNVPKRVLALAGKGDSGRSDIASNIKGAYLDSLIAKHRPARASRSR